MLTDDLHTNPIAINSIHKSNETGDRVKIGPMKC